MDLFFSILNMSIASSVLFLLVLLLRRILRGAGSTGFLYMLWMPLLFRMLVPYSLPSPASLFNIFGKDLATPGGVLVSVEYLDPYQPVLQNVAGGEQLFTKQLLAALAAVWAAGVLGQAAWVLARYLVLRKKLARGRSADLRGLQPLFDRATGGRRTLVAYSAAVSSPLVFGFLHPKIALPAAMEGRSEGVECILLHELTHVRRKDHIVLQLFTAAAILHWFNPLAWLARRLMVRDMEAACDERVLELLAPARLVEALETGNASMLAQLASMDPAYYEPVYAPFAGVRLQVKNARLYYNSKNAAEVYLTVEVQQGGGIYSKGEGTLVARLSQTDYRAEPFVSCLMPPKKYEAIHMPEDENEAVRLAGNLNEAQAGAGFEAEELSPVVVARVCMESAVEDTGQKPPFTREEMALLAEEYFAIDGFFCDDPAVYDGGAGVYVYAPARGQTCCPVEFSQSAQGETTVSVESYRDPMGVFPSTRLQCQLTRSN